MLRAAGASVGMACRGHVEMVTSGAVAVVDAEHRHRVVPAQRGEHVLDLGVHRRGHGGDDGVGVDQHTQPSVARIESATDHLGRSAVRMQLHGRQCRKPFGAGGEAVHGDGDNVVAARPRRAHPVLDPGTGLAVGV